MRTFVDSEENRTDEDREYREEYGDDYTEGASAYFIVISHYGRTCMVVCFLDGHYLDTTLPLLTLLLG